MDSPHNCEGLSIEGLLLSADVETRSGPPQTGGLRPKRPRRLSIRSPITVPGNPGALSAPLHSRCLAISPLKKAKAPATSPLSSLDPSAHIMSSSLPKAPAGSMASRSSLPRPPSPRSHKSFLETPLPCPGKHIYGWGLLVPVRGQLLFWDLSSPI